MGKRSGRKLGNLELRILNVLWESGQSTVRDVLETLQVKPRPAYTTVLTIMRLMHEKGYLTRKERGRAHVYQARLREQSVKQGILRDLRDSVFRGSAQALMVRLLEDEQLSAEDLAQVKELIEARERSRAR